MMQKGNSSPCWHSFMREMAFPAGVHIKLHLNLVSLHLPPARLAKCSHFCRSHNFFLSFSVMNNFTARNNVMVLCMRGAAERLKIYG